MITKILEEMRNLRLKGNYLEYRTLSNIAINYIYTEIIYTLRYGYQIDDYNVKELKDTVTKWLENEIKDLKEIVNFSLENKFYKDLKIVSQVHNDLMRILQQIYCNDRKNIFIQSGIQLLASKTE